ncbi:MAG: competence protein ComK [Bacilli bacterium]|nr:competence protein ComK [Bacilli bacterium]
MIEQYEINTSTLAVLPSKNNMSKVVELDNTFLVKKSPTRIIDDSCKYFGSSYIGRFEGTKTLIGYNYKAPIIVEETREIIFFPTASPRLYECEWISLNNIKDYHRSGNKVEITFKNNVKIELLISLNTIENQILRATRLESILRKRKEG